MNSWTQQNTVVREYMKIFTTYPFSDPDPVPRFGAMSKAGKIYPYYRYDGYTNKPVQKEWKVVELENDYIKIMILPEVGGKIWAAIEKSTGKPFIYYNHVVKFRDVALRGPWTSGGIEYNYGIIGHTPDCATPVDYTILKKSDGSVSCVVGALDLFTRTNWRIEVNLQRDKAYFTTSSFWYNPTPLEQPYYHWMNVGIKAAGNLEFIYPGTMYIDHDGTYRSWPVNKDNGREISFYGKNNFGGSKSYHIFGKYTDFFGGYWHDDDFGTGRYSPRDEKPGKKIWIWGLSPQGMLWEKLLTDDDGQYVEIQSGRLFNQAREQSTFTPFKHKGFPPKTTDLWTEYWFPVLKTKGFVEANSYGALNVNNANGWLKIYFSPVQPVNDELKITAGEKIIYRKTLQLKTLRLFTDSVRIASGAEHIKVTLGENKLVYDSSPDAGVLSRPVATPADFDWNSVYGLYVQGKEDIRLRHYALAEEKLRECLAKDPCYLPALVDISMLLYQRMQYKEAMSMAIKALSIDTYDPAANYYYGLISSKLGNIADARDGYDIASFGLEYRSASYSMLSGLYMKEHDYDRAVRYAYKSIDFNKYAVDAWQMLAVIYRLLGKEQKAKEIHDKLLSMDPLSHFARFEKYLCSKSGDNRKQFTDLFRGEMPQEIYLELAIWYYSYGRKEDAVELLQMAPDHAEILYWRTFLENKKLNNAELKPDLVFPFRQETAEVLQKLISSNDHWMLKYHLALIHWNCNNLDFAKELFSKCGQEPAYAPFYAARAELNMKTEVYDVAGDFQKAMNIDRDQWRFGKSLASYYISEKKYDRALPTAREYYNRFRGSYIMEMLYAKTLILNNRHKEALDILKKTYVLPYEGATEARQLYKESNLVLAVNEMSKKNYRKSLSYISASRQWPENLGAGKPYDSDIDDRLEDWLAYESYSGMGNKTAANGMLEKILSFKPQKTYYLNTYSTANNLVSAWAMQKKGMQDQAEEYLQSWIKREPQSELAKWVMKIYRDKKSILTDSELEDDNLRMLNYYTVHSQY